MPEFASMIPMREFEFEPSKLNVQRAIGSFFGSTSNYYRMTPRTFDSFVSKYNLEVTDEEMKALHRLITYSTSRVDDRRFAIELHSSEEFKLQRRNVLAVVMPEEYITSDFITDYIEKTLGATIITYPVYSMRVEMYYHTIYMKIEAFLKDKGLF
jgi:hypothetical protein